MPNDVLFSIIIPTYNRASILPRAIESVITQDFSNWELIIIDDGSTDTTRAEVEKFLKDGRISYFWQKNKELNAARNTGIKLAKGTYLAFLDDDDYYLPNHLSYLAKILKDKNYPHIAIRTRMWRTNKGFKQKSILLNDSFPSCIGHFWQNPTNLLSFVFHSSIFQTHIFNEELILAEDFHFLLRVLLDFPFVQLDEVTVVYQLQETSRSVSYYSEKHLEKKINSFNDIWLIRGEDLLKYLPHNALKRKITREYLHFTRISFRNNAKKLGWKYFFSALKQFDIKAINDYTYTFLIGIFK
ncbi:MAG: hypothetical protein DA408_11255 [Bacteroidetes bacterium]|nr:MAG: hypothetical protein C7N36_14170 [Bacteroidota bacterium]PTM12252.1 MAG: hypothetical protein DA408_11255 [Bacteroidota bacterium]